MLQDIVNFPMDEFNDLLSKRELTEEQLNLCRDIRRRGKNKVSDISDQNIVRRKAARQEQGGDENVESAMITS